MTEFLSSATPPQLLILMSFPLVLAVIIVGYFVYLSRRHRNKSKMKHGVQAATSPASERPASGPTSDLETGASNQPPSPVGPVNTTLPAEEPSSAPSDESMISPAEAELNLAILSSSVDTETFGMDTAEQPTEEKIDLAARLDNQPGDVVQPAEPAELMRLLRDPQSGAVIVEIAGQRYPKLSDIADKEIGQYVLKLTAHLLAFNNGMIATEKGVKSVYMPKLGEAPMPLTAPIPVSQLPDPSAFAPPPTPVAPEPEPTTSQPEPEPEPSPETEITLLASLRSQSAQSGSQSEGRGFFGRPKPGDKGIILPSLNLAAEINKIVQARLMVSPLAATTKLDIVSDPNGGIQIRVNNTLYSSPDDIPDPAVRALIKESIKQWEQS